MNAGIYIHVPFCAKKCPYCDFYSVQYRADAAERYADAVIRNIAALPADIHADSVYFGGGTPSLLPEMHIQRIIDAIYARCEMAPDTEITLEANPLTLTDKKLRAWRECGINRLSVGVQSFQADVLAGLGRKHSPQQAADAVKRAADIGYVNLSIDLMTGLSMQTEQSVAEDLRMAAELPVTHISSYMLKIEEGTPFAEHPPDCLSEDDLAARYLQIHNALTAAGFRHYEISNFAKPGFESRHNCKYWRLAPYYGIGPAAHSCYGGVRYAVSRDLAAFCDAPVQIQTVTEPHAESESERIMLGLRMAEGIRLDSVPESRSRLMRRAKPLIPQYLESDGETLRMTPQGWLVSNAVLVQLGI